MKAASYALNRLVALIPVLLGVTIVVFLLTELIPGDPAVIILGQFATQEDLNNLRQQMGLDKPVLLRYLSWVFGVVRGDFGTSLIDGSPVLPEILGRFPATTQLLTGAVLVAVLLGIPAGIISAVYRGQAIDTFTRIAALLGVAVPSFWQALLLVMLFSYWWPLLPSQGYGTLKNMVLPVMVLGTHLTAVVMRMMRASVLEVLQEDYIRTARAKGLGQRLVLFKHTLRNSLLPVVTYLGLQIGFLFGGTVIVETIFQWPGVGRFAYTRMMQRDYPSIMANLFVFAVVISLVNILTDLFYAWVDPRIRYS